MDDPFVSVLRPDVVLRCDERTVLAMVREHSHWLLVTTLRTVYRQGPYSVEILHGDVVWADYDGMVLSYIPKADLYWLDIETKSGVVRLEFEPGTPFRAFESFYMWLGRRNYGRAERDLKNQIA